MSEPAPNISAALGDAVWMTGMEWNSDLVIMSCYALLSVNANKGGMQWRTDPINFDVHRILSFNLGDVVLPIAAEGVPTREWQPPAGRGVAGAPPQPPPPPPTQRAPALFFNATRDTRTGSIYRKVVKRAGSPQPVRVKMGGLSKIDLKG